MILLYYWITMKKIHVSSYNTSQAGHKEDDNRATGFKSLKEMRRDSRHETLNHGDDRWVVDQLRKHVGIVVHHLPQNHKGIIFTTV